MRSDEIRQEALSLYSHANVRDRYDADLMMAGFADGAGWADTHPAEVPEPQGEPSAAEIEAAAAAAYRAGACRYVNMATLGQWMRAALRAAGDAHPETWGDEPSEVEVDAGLKALHPWGNFSFNPAARDAVRAVLRAAGGVR